MVPGKSVSVLIVECGLMDTDNWPVIVIKDMDRILLRIRIANVKKEDYSLVVQDDRFIFEHFGSGTYYFFEFRFRHKVRPKTVRFRVR